MDGEGWNRHWKFRGRHWISDEQKLADVSETGLSWKSEGKDDEDVMFDGITITPSEGGKVGVGRMGYCDGVEAGHVELPLLAVKPGSGRPSRSAKRAPRPGHVQNPPDATLS